MHTHSTGKKNKKSDFWTMLNITSKLALGTMTKTIYYALIIDAALSYAREEQGIKVLGHELPFDWIGLGAGATLGFITEIGAYFAHKALHTNHQGHNCGKECKGHEAPGEGTHLVNPNPNPKISCIKETLLALDYLSHATETGASLLLILQALAPSSVPKWSKIVTGVVGTGAGFFFSHAEYRTCRRNVVNDDHHHDDSHDHHHDDNHDHNHDYIVKIN